MLRNIVIALAALWATVAPALADPIAGNWKTKGGHLVSIAGTGPFTIVIMEGRQAGRQIGLFTATGDGGYAGKITDPSTDKTYSGTAGLEGDNLTLKGCVFAGLICTSQRWTRASD